MKLIVDLSQVKFKTPHQLSIFFFSLLIGLSVSSCLDLVENTDAPCGGPADCSAPRMCISGQCVAVCYNDNDCANNEMCVRQLCVTTTTIDTEPFLPATSGEAMNAGEPMNAGMN